MKEGYRIDASQAGGWATVWSCCIKIVCDNNSAGVTVQRVLESCGPLLARIEGREYKGNNEADYFVWLNVASLMLAGRDALHFNLSVRCNKYDMATAREAFKLLPGKFRRIEPEELPKLKANDYSEILKAHPLPLDFGEPPMDPGEKATEERRVEYEQAHDDFSNRFTAFYAPFCEARQKKIRNLRMARKIIKVMESEDIVDNTSQVCTLPKEIGEQLLPPAFPGVPLPWTAALLYELRPSKDLHADRYHEKKENLKSEVTIPRRHIVTLDLSYLLARWGELWEKGRLQMPGTYNGNMKCWLYLTGLSPKFMALDEKVMKSKAFSTKEKLRHPPFGSARSLMVVLMPEGYLEWPQEKRNKVQLVIVHIPTAALPNLMTKWWLKQYGYYVVDDQCAKMWVDYDLEALKASELSAAKALGYPGIPTAELPGLKSSSQQAEKKPRELPPAPATPAPAQDDKAQPAPEPSDEHAQATMESQMRAAAARVSGPSN